MISDIEWVFAMKDFFLNFTKILETNSKIYWSLIAGIAVCLILYIAEIVHIQSVYSHISAKDPMIIRAILDPIAQSYKWARIATLFFAIVWSIIQFKKTKKALNLN